MGEVVNLRRARKAKARVEAADLAAANRVAYGRTKTERAARAADAARLDRTLDGVKRDA